MNILVLAPMHSEYQNVKNALKSSEHHYDIVEIGVGKANAAANTALSLYNPSLHYRYDHVFLIGYCASTPHFSLGEVVSPTSISAYDVNVPQELNLLPTTFNLDGFSEDTVLFSGDSFVTKSLSDSLTLLHPKACFDMEAAAVAQVLSDFDIPLTVLKLVSDIPAQGSTPTSFSEFVSSHSDFYPLVFAMESFLS